MQISNKNQRYWLKRYKSGQVDDKTPWKGRVKVCFDRSPNSIVPFMWIKAGKNEFCSERDRFGCYLHLIQDMNFKHSSQSLPC